MGSQHTPSRLSSRYHNHGQAPRQRFPHWCHSCPGQHCQCYKHRLVFILSSPTSPSLTNLILTTLPITLNRVTRNDVRRLPTSYSSRTLHTFNALRTRIPHLPKRHYSPPPIPSLRTPNLLPNSPPTCRPRARTHYGYRVQRYHSPRKVDADGEGTRRIGVDCWK